MDEPLQELRLAVTGTAENVGVLKAALEGNGEGKWLLGVAGERRATEKCLDELKR